MNEPDYYNHDGLSPIQAFKQGLISKDEYIGFCKGNIIKYIVRAGKKDDAVVDLEKTKNYIDFLMEIYQEDMVEDNGLLNCHGDYHHLSDIKKNEILKLAKSLSRNFPYKGYNMCDPLLK